MSYQEIKDFCDANNVTLVAVSKTKPVEMIRGMYQMGQRVFGENRVQELIEKHDQLPTDIQWHMIGHLQSRKVKDIISFVSLIHSVDSIKLLNKINREAKAVDRVVDILIQFHIAKEESKYGFTSDDIDPLLEVYSQLSHVQIRGVMGMATFTDDEQLIESEFNQLKSIYNKLKDNVNQTSFDTLSMGMSGDYKIAVDCGSNMIRIGSLLFGKRG